MLNNEESSRQVLERVRLRVMLPLWKKGSLKREIIGLRKEKGRYTSYSYY